MVTETIGAILVALMFHGTKMHLLYNFMWSAVIERGHKHARPNGLAYLVYVFNDGHLKYQSYDVQFFLIISVFIMPHQRYHNTNSFHIVHTAVMILF